MKQTTTTQQPASHATPQTANHQPAARKPRALPHYAVRLTLDQQPASDGTPRYWLTVVAVTKAGQLVTGRHAYEHTISAVSLADLTRGWDIRPETRVFVTTSPVQA